MTGTNILNTRTINYLELIGNGRSYRVPPYQRDYSWSEEHWEDLWNDIADLRSLPEDRYYLGALVVEGKSDREFLVRHEQSGDSRGVDMGGDCGVGSEALPGSDDAGIARC